MGLTTRIDECPSESVTVGDGICDEENNIQECGYDGEDCCLELKSTSLCQNNCDCKLTLDKDYLTRAFLDSDVHLLLTDIATLMPIISFEIIYTIETVVSTGVCAMLCLDGYFTENVNAWSFINKTCTCGWIGGSGCLDKYPIGLERLTEFHTSLEVWNSQAYLQLSKILPCCKTLLTF